MGRRKPNLPGRPADQPGDRGVGWPWLLAVFLLALTYRGLCFWQMRGEPLFRYPVVDGGYHDAWAQRIVAGDWLGHGPDDVFKPPLYAYFLAGLYGLFGRHVAAAQWAQHVLGAGSCVLVAALAGRLVGRWPGRVAGLLAALYAPYVFFESQLLTPALSIVLNTAALLLLVRAWPRPSYAALAGVGLIFGLSAGVRADVILPASLVLLYLLLRGQGVSWSRRAAKAGCLAAGAAVVVVPIALRNYHLTGQLIPISSNAGINLYVGNVAGDGTTAVPVGLRWEKLVSRVPQAVLERPASASRFWTRRTWQEAAGRPGQALARLGRKALAFLNGREFRNNVCFHFMQRRSWLLRPPLVQYAMLLPLAVCGLVLLRSAGGEGRRTALALCVLWVGGYWLAGVVFFVTARFRLPATPLLFLPAGFATVRIAEAVRRRQPRTILACGVSILLAGALAWPAWFGQPDEAWVRDYVNLGNGLRAAQDLTGAERAYRSALAAADDPDAHFLLGRLLLATRPAAALSQLQAAERLLPESPDLLLALGHAYLATGQAAEAQAALKRLVGLQIGRNLWVSRAAWANAHVLLAELEPGAAEHHWQEAWRIDPATAAEAAFLRGRDLQRVLETFGAGAHREPWNWYWQANWGLALLAADRPADAVAPLRRASRLAPEGKEGVQLELALALAAAGRTDEALDVLGRMCRTLPEGPLRRRASALRAELSPRRN